MGKQRKQKKAVSDKFDSSDADSVSSTSTAFSDLNLNHETDIVESQHSRLEMYLDALYEKRGSTREKALIELLNAFESKVLLGFIETRCITFLHQYLNSIKRGSTKEVCLATRALGLLAITAGFGERTHEIMEHSISPLSRALISGPDAVRTSVLDCLAIVTFIGSNNSEETEVTMKILWEIIHPKSLSKAGTITKPSNSLLIRALSAWSFLLTTLVGWRVDLDMWTETILFLSDLLQEEDWGVRIAAGEAIAIIFEVLVAEKLSAVSSDSESTEGVTSKPKWFLYLLSLKEKILSLMSELSVEEGGKGIDKKSLNTQSDTFQKIYDYIKEGEHLETSIKLSNKHRVLNTSSWTELIQLNFLKHFLGSGFLKHAQDNELLHNLFGLEQEEADALSISEKNFFGYIRERERAQALRKDRQIAQRFFRSSGEVEGDEDLRKDNKKAQRIFRSLGEKERAEALRKGRQIAQSRKGTVMISDEE